MRIWRSFLLEKGEENLKQHRDIHTLEIWSAREVVQAGFSRNLAYQILARADVPTIRIGGRIFVRREAFQQWLKNQEQTKV